MKPGPSAGALRKGKKAMKDFEGWWLYEDIYTAEGWCLSEVDGRIVELQRLDEAAVFECDEDAADFVVARVCANSTPHCEIMSLLRAHSPSTYTDILVAQPESIRNLIEDRIADIKWRPAKAPAVDADAPGDRPAFPDYDTNRIHLDA
jgi:hypothetical protein